MQEPRNMYSSPLFEDGMAKIKEFNGGDMWHERRKQRI